MPLYEFKCQKCHTINEVLCKMGEKIIMCPQRLPTSIPGLLEKCEGSVEKIASIFCVHDPWRWIVASEDGMAYMEDPGDPSDYLYESADEEEFYEGPDRDEDSSPLDNRFHDGVRWDQRKEWVHDQHYFEGEADDERTMERKIQENYVHEEEDF